MYRDHLHVRGPERQIIEYSTTSDDQIIDVPHTSLRPDTLRRVIEEFVSRDGTDYGDVEKTLDQKITDVLWQLERGEAKVV